MYKKEFIINAQELYKVQTLRKQLEQKEEELKIKLRVLTEDKGGRAGGYVWECTERKGMINYKAIPMLQGLNLEPFRSGPVKVWKLSVEPANG